MSVALVQKSLVGHSAADLHRAAQAAAHTEVCLAFEGALDVGLALKNIATLPMVSPRIREIASRLSLAINSESEAALSDLERAKP